MKAPLVVDKFYNNFFLRFYNAHPALFSIFVVCFGYSLFNINDALIKSFSAEIGLFEIIFWNSFFAFLTINALSLMAGYKKSLRTQKLNWHLLRSGFALIGWVCVVLALKNLELATFYAITFFSPLVCVVLAWAFFKDSVGWKKLLASVIGFLGILVIAQPGNISLGIGLLAALGLVITHSLSMMIVRKIGKDEPKLAFSFFVSGIGAITSFSISVAQGTFVIPDVSILCAFAFIGFCSALAGTSVSTAFQIAPSTSTVAPFHYIQIVWGVLIGFFFWNEIPTFYTMLGSSIVIASGVWIIFLEKGRKSPIATPLEKLLENSITIEPEQTLPPNRDILRPAT